MKVAFITNICPHYRVKTFETLARRHQVRFFFFSAGDEWYWQREHGVETGQFEHEYLGGVTVAGTRITPSLPWRLLTGDYDVYIKCIVGRFALPVAYLVARLRRRPILLWTGVWMRLRSPAHRLLFPLTRWLYRHVDGIVVYGEHVKRYLVSEGVPPERIFVAAHAVDNARFQRPVSAAELTALRRRLGLTDSDRVVLYLGRLESNKGLDHLLRAFARADITDAVLVLVGTGQERAALEQLAQSEGVAARVRFTGYVANEATVEMYALAETYVLPSVSTPVSKETWGLAVNEAFNQGVPVIVTDAVGAAAGGLVEHGVNGLVVPEGDVQALTAALVAMLGDPHKRRRMGQAARAKIESWDNEAMVEGFARAIAAVAARQS